MKELFNFFGGRKNATVWIAIISMAVLAGFGTVTVDKFIETLTWLVALGVGSIAVEDGLIGLGKGRK